MNGRQRQRFLAFRKAIHHLSLASKDAFRHFSGCAYVVYTFTEVWLSTDHSCTKRMWPGPVQKRVEHWLSYVRKAG